MMRRQSFASTLVWSLCILSGCSSNNANSGFSPATDNDGGSPITGDGGAFNFGEASTQDVAQGSDGIVAVIRDMKLYVAGDSTTVPDFENTPGPTGPWDDRDIVQDALGSDGKPIYKNIGGSTVTTHGKDAFDKWYRDVPGVNIHVDYPLPLTKNADGSMGYDSQISGIALSPTEPNKQFFPIDDGTPYATAFGNQGDPHNYSFTVEIHTIFTYRGGEYLNFRGDDDVFVYVNGRLIINLGGIHDPEPGQIVADNLGLTKGADYPLDFFFAERHKRGSNILFTTTFALRQAPPR
jgi:fibro-slime domain-containing protein